MSYHPVDDPQPGDALACSAIEQVIVPSVRDVGGFEVRRALPSTGRKMVGPFIFFDQMGPAEFRPGQGLDMPPHPHIGLAKMTYLFDGEIMHRDSLGTVLPIRPGELNLMTAGRGIVHSERTGPEARAAGSRLFGIQAWAALPKSHEERAPDFAHHGSDDLPVLRDTGMRARLLMGSAWGETSPVAFPWPALCAEVVLAPGAVTPLDADHDERAVYIVSGVVDIAGDSFGPGRLLIFRPGDRISIMALSNARLMVFGGEPMDGPRHIWWNFVSSSRERIDQARQAWRQGRFDAVPGETDVIPLPEL